MREENVPAVIRRRAARPVSEKFAAIIWRRTAGGREPPARHQSSGGGPPGPWATSVPPSSGVVRQVRARNWEDWGFHKSKRKTRALKTIPCRL